MGKYLCKNTRRTYLVSLNGVEISSNCLQGSLTEGKAQYGQPPFTNKLRSAAFCIENIIYLCYKTSYLNVEVNCTEPSPSVSIPCHLILSKSSFLSLSLSFSLSVSVSFSFSLYLPRAYASLPLFL